MRKSTERKNLSLLEESFFDEVNDEEKEKLARHKNKLISIKETDQVDSEVNNENRRKSNKFKMSSSQISDHYATCVKLCAENKITTQNAFSLHLIDYMAQIVQSQSRENDTNFQVASNTIDASSKIYSYRVDGYYKETFKLLSILCSKSDEKDPDNGGDNIDPEGRNDENEKAKTKKKADQLFQKISSGFDTGSPRGLFLHNTLVKSIASYGLLFDHRYLHDNPDKNIELGNAEKEQAPGEGEDLNSGNEENENLMEETIDEYIRKIDYNKYIICSATQDIGFSKDNELNVSRMFDKMRISESRNGYDGAKVGQFGLENVSYTLLDMMEDNNNIGEDHEQNGNHNLLDIPEVDDLNLEGDNVSLLEENLELSLNNINFNENHKDSHNIMEDLNKSKEWDSENLAQMLMSQQNLDYTRFNANSIDARLLRPRIPAFTQNSTDNNTKSFKQRKQKRLLHKIFFETMRGEILPNVQNGVCVLLTADGVKLPAQYDLCTETFELSYKPVTRKNDNQLTKQSLNKMIKKAQLLRRQEISKYTDKNESKFDKINERIDAEQELFGIHALPYFKITMNNNAIRLVRKHLDNNINNNLTRENTYFQNESIKRKSEISTNTPSNLQNNVNFKNTENLGDILLSVHTLSYMSFNGKELEKQRQSELFCASPTKQQPQANSSRLNLSGVENHNHSFMNDYNENTTLVEDVPNRTTTMLNGEIINNDTYLGTQFLQPTRKIENLHIHFEKRNKVTDIRNLKKQIWDILSLNFGSNPVTQQKYTNLYDTEIERPSSPILFSQFDKINGHEHDNNITNSISLTKLRKTINTTSLTNGNVRQQEVNSNSVSNPILVLSLLFLANEKILKLENNSTFSDLTITLDQE
ncbi:unnamed protein product [Gordionus sp. m RMFG-2023]